MTGRIGATYHISFPVVNRASFGIWGALWPVFNRAAMASIWYGVQGWIGGTCVRLMIRAIWNNWRNVNSLCQFFFDFLTNFSFLGRHSWRRRHCQWHPQFWHQHCRIRLFLPFLGRIPPVHLSAGSQDSPFVHRQGLLCTHCRNCLFHLGDCTSKGTGSYR